MTAEALAALIVFVLTFVGILSGKVHRTIVGAVGAVVMITVGLRMGFYSESQALEAIDFNTLGLLTGMMILVGLLEQTGLFQYLAVAAGRVSHGRPWLLLIALGTTTTVLSMFLDNVTTIVLIAPVTIRIADTLGIRVIPLLMAEALLSDIGGVATLVGDPPNIIIGSAAGFSFNDFLTHALPLTLVAWVAALIALLIVFRRDLAQAPENIDDLMRMRAADAIHDPASLRKILIVFGFVVALFFAHDALHISPAFVALAGASAGLLWVRPEIERALESVEWSVLLFFAGLFVTVGGLEASGILESAGAAVAGVAQDNLPMAGVAVLWTASIASSIVDNIPLTIAMVPVIQQLGEIGIATSPLWWALVFGAGLGGNGTPIGSTSNVVTITFSERTSTPITTLTWLKSGTIIMLLTTVIASVLYVVLFDLFKTP